VEALLSNWREKKDKLAELVAWLVQAERELRGVKKADPRWVTLGSVKAAKERLEQEIEQLEQGQEAALTDRLAEEGPVTLWLEDGSTRVLAGSLRTAGGVAPLLPADLLRVWRVAEVFGGSVVLDGERAALRFGWRDQLEALKAKPKEKKAKKNAVIGDEASLFGRD
jgi:hypothetical protein